MFDCECTEYSDVASSNEYSHVASSSCREGGQVHFNVPVRGLVPWFVYELEIKWTLRSYKLVHRWKSVVKTTDTDSYTLREPLMQRGDDFHFGIMAWAAYKKGNDPFVIEATVRDMHPGLTSEEALIGTRNIDSSVSAVRLKCEEKKPRESTETQFGTDYKLHSVQELSAKLQEAGGGIDHSGPDEDDEEQAPVPDIEDENKNEEQGGPKAWKDKGNKDNRWPTDTAAEDAQLQALRHKRRVVTIMEPHNGQVFMESNNVQISFTVEADQVHREREGVSESKED